ncbi:MAG: hypothetical protein V8S82_05815 [Eubacteriales bacterium]
MYYRATGRNFETPAQSPARIIAVKYGKRHEFFIIAFCASNIARAELMTDNYTDSRPKRHKNATLITFQRVVVMFMEAITLCPRIE